MSRSPSLPTGPPCGNQAASRRFEELAALRTATMATSLRDRSAVEAVADAIDKEPATVYALLDDRIHGNPLSRLCAWLDACVATKGNANALEPAWLIYRRYLAPNVPADLPDAVNCGASLLREVGEAVTALVHSLPTATPAQAIAVLAEIDDVIREAHRARAMAERVASGATIQGASR